MINFSRPVRKNINPARHRTGGISIQVEGDLLLIFYFIPQPTSSAEKVVTETDVILKEKVVINFIIPSVLERLSHPFVIMTLPMILFRPSVIPIGRLQEGTYLRVVILAGIIIDRDMDIKPSSVFVYVIEQSK
jgi:hypothetical protein